MNSISEFDNFERNHKLSENINMLYPFDYGKLGPIGPIDFRAILVRSKDSKVGPLFWGSLRG